eukprot:gene9403-19509_t
MEISEYLDSQLAEIDLVSSAYSSELVIPAHTLEAIDEMKKISLLPKIDLCFKICLSISEKSIEIQITIPQKYPSKPLRIHTECISLSNETLRSLNEKLNTEIETLHMDGNIMSSLDAIQMASEEFENIIHTTININEHITINKINNILQTLIKFKISRSLIYFHHIKSQFKKKEIVDNAQILELGGFWKEGFPGIVIIEGSHENVLEFIRRIQRLRWQHMVVRGEQTEDIPEGVSFTEFRRLPLPLVEVDSMSTLGQKCTDCEIHDLFMTSMKVY